jgi:hypothetical protein
MLAILRPKHVGGTSESDKWLFVVNCVIVGLNAIQTDIILSAVVYQFRLSTVVKQ